MVHKQSVPVLLHIQDNISILPMGFPQRFTLLAFTLCTVSRHSRFLVVHFASRLSYNAVKFSWNCFV